MLLTHSLPIFPLKTCAQEGRFRQDDVLNNMKCFSWLTACLYLVLHGPALDQDCVFEFESVCSPFCHLIAHLILTSDTGCKLRVGLFNLFC